MCVDDAPRPSVAPQREELRAKFRRKKCRNATDAVVTRGGDRRPRIDERAEMLTCDQWLVAKRDEHVTLGGLDSTADRRGHALARVRVFDGRKAAYGVPDRAIRRNDDDCRHDMSGDSRSPDHQRLPFEVHELLRAAESL